jgi:hypothetical protein
MPLQKQHTDQAEHNLAASKHLVENSDFYDWSATTAFYAAVHYVESVLSYLFVNKKSLIYFKNDVQIGDSSELISNVNFPSYSGKPLYSAHKIRKELIEKNFGHIHGSYVLLSDASWTQRYTNWKQNDKPKCKRLIEKHLIPIKEWHDKLTSAETIPQICRGG